MLNSHFVIFPTFNNSHEQLKHKWQKKALNHFRAHRFKMICLKFGKSSHINQSQECTLFQYIKPRSREKKENITKQK